MADYKGAFNDLLNLVKEKNCGPILIRFSWHDAGTYCQKTKTGGPGATIRFEPECLHAANAGLKIALDLVSDIKAKYPDICWTDFIVLGGIAATYGMGGPKIPFKAGRNDRTKDLCAEDGRLPDAHLGADHLRTIFHRMGFSDKDIVALSGAHSVGRCHADRSGFEGPWTDEPFKFDNTYFVDLLKDDWKKNEQAKEPQFINSKGNMMLPTDIALKEDDVFRKYAEEYANSQDVFFKDFSESFSKLQELGYDSLTPVEIY